MPPKQLPQRSSARKDSASTPASAVDKDVYCPVCTKPVGVDSIQCDLCGDWSHRICTKLSHEQCDLLAGNDSCLFKCNSCKTSGSSMPTTALVAELKRVTDQLARLATENARIREENARLSDRVSQLENNAITANIGAMVTAVREYFDQEKKKDNMVIHALPEPITGSLEEKTAKDTETVQGFLSDLGGNSATIIEAYRMGKERQDGKPRPVKVICNNSWSKRSLMFSQSKLVRSHPELANKGFFIRDDMTVFQREQDKKLRDYLAEKRVQHPDKKLVIRNGAICIKNENGKGATPFQE